MEEQLITLETAKLAKEKGFNISTEQCYAETRQYSIYDPRRGDDLIFEYKSPRILPTNYTWDDKNTSIVCYAPTQSLLQKWLREVHGIHIQVYTMERWLESGNDMEIYFEVNLKTTHRLNGLSNIKFNMLTFKTYEEALEGALQESLKLIINE